VSGSGVLSSSWVSPDSRAESLPAVRQKFHLTPCAKIRDHLSHPSPDLLVAQALMQTKNIRLGPGGFLLPFHHPAQIANRVAILDHISGGRLNFGIAASGLPSDWEMFNVDGADGVNRLMMREALDIILKLWSSNEPFTYAGKYWTVKNPELMYGFLKPHIKPMQT